MIDIENEVFDKIYDCLVERFDGINVTSDYVAMPQTFPCASIYEADNFAYEKSQDSASNENHVKVMYEVYVFSNKRSGRKTECKEIFEVIDGQMLQFGFTRVSKKPLPRDDGAMYQLIGRYEAVVSKNKQIFRR